MTFLTGYDLKQPLKSSNGFDIGIVTAILLGLMTSVSEKNKWKALAFSTLIRFSFHTYQGLLWAPCGLASFMDLFYYFMYKKVVKNLLPFFLMHALADMFGSSLMYLLINWGS